MEGTDYEDVGCDAIASILLTDYEMHKKGNKGKRRKIGAGVAADGRSQATLRERIMERELLKKEIAT